MGCDIHSYIEERHDGQWQMGPPIYESDHRRNENHHDVFGDEYKEVLSPIDRRNYALFGFLVDHIRNAGPTCLGLLGMEDEAVLRDDVPDDISPELRLEYMNDLGDAHTHSWLTLRELHLGFTAANLQGYATNYREQLRFSLDQMLARAKKVGLSHDDMRLVFWFGN